METFDIDHLTGDPMMSQDTMINMPQTPFSNHDSECNGSLDDNFDDLMSIISNDYPGLKENTDQTIDTLEKKVPASQDTGKSNGKTGEAYVTIIARALLSSKTGKMTLREIYSYVRENYSCYDNGEKGWRNSIRHNLSINECFVKDDKEQSGKCHYWSIHQNCLDNFKKGDFRRRQARRRARRNVTSVSTAPPNAYVDMRTYTPMSQTTELNMMQRPNANIPGRPMQPLDVTLSTQPMQQQNVNQLLQPNTVFPTQLRQQPNNTVLPTQRRQQPILNLNLMKQPNAMFPGQSTQQPNTTLTRQPMQQRNLNVMQHWNPMLPGEQTSFHQHLTNQTTTFSFPSNPATHHLQRYTRQDTSTSGYSAPPSDTPEVEGNMSYENLLRWLK